VSSDVFNYGPAQLLVVLPLTTALRGIPSHVLVNPPEGGTRRRSFIKCEDVRSVSIERLIQRWGAVTDATLAAVEDRLRMLLQL
jgi:mRNA interferase MazF